MQHELSSNRELFRRNITDLSVLLSTENMSDPDVIREQNISEVQVPQSRQSTPERKRRGRRPKSGARPTESNTSSQYSTKALQALEKQVSDVKERATEIEKQLKMLDKIQSEVRGIEGKIAKIDRTSQETLSIVQRIKLKKKKGNKNKKNKN